MDNKSNNGNFWLGFFLGGVIGGFIIFLMGTKKGRKILEKIIDQTETYEEDLEEKLLDIEGKGENFLAEAGKIENIKKKVEDIAKKGVELTNEVRHNYFRKNGKKLTA